jgi:hypothetical protein
MSVGGAVIIAIFLCPLFFTKLEMCEKPLDDLFLPMSFVPPYTVVRVAISVFSLLVIDGSLEPGISRPLISKSSLILFEVYLLIGQILVILYYSCSFPTLIIRGGKTTHSIKLLTEEHCFLGCDSF